jgi:MoxR-like ATPase
LLEEAQRLRQGDPFKNLRSLLAGEISKVVIGHDDVVELMIAAVTLNGHVLVEGVPGVAKTLLANAVARSMAVEFRRVQFTVDTQPSDILGTFVSGQLGLVLKHGPIFTNVLLADEINRTMPKTQSALLEAMQERQVTMEGRPNLLPDPFLVIATQNPVEHETTFPLPDAQLDRFLFKVDVGYPSLEEEIAMLELTHKGVISSTLEDVHPVLIAGDLLDARTLADQTYVAHEVASYVAEIVRHTRKLSRVALGCSPRSAVHLLAASKASARFAGRDFVVPEDVGRMAPHVLAHRIVLAPEAAEAGYSSKEAVADTLAAVPAPLPAQAPPAPPAA